MLMDDSLSAKLGSNNVSAIISNNSLYVFPNQAIELTKSITGSSFIEKNGGGVLVLSGNNNYTGNTTIRSGILCIDSVSALPGFNSNGRYSVVSGATLAFRSSVTDAEFTGILGTNNYAPGAFVGFDTSVGSRAYANIISNSSSGARGLVKLGPNTLTLSASNTYTHDTRVLMGTLATSTSDRIHNSSSLIVENDGVFLISGWETLASIAGGGTINLLYNSLTTNSNSLSINPVFSGKINGQNSGNNGFIKNGNYKQIFSGSTIFSGATIHLRQGVTDFNGSFVLNRPSNVRNFQLANSSINDVATGNLNGNMTLSGGLMLGDNGAGTSVFNINSGAVLDANGEIWFAGKSSTLNVAGTANLGPNAFYMGGGNSPTTSILNLSGNGFISGSRLDLARGGFNNETIINLGNGTTGAKLHFNGIAIFNNSSGHKINFNGGALSAFDLINHTGVFFNILSGGAIFDINQNAITRIGSLCPLTGVGGLIKTGFGILSLEGTNTYSGDTFINQGTLRLGNAGTLGNISQSSKIINNSILIISRENDDLFSQKISGTGTLIKQGAGTALLSGDNSYSGITRLEGGTLEVSSSTALGATRELTFAGGSVRLGQGISSVSFPIKNSTSAITINTNNNNVVFTGLIDSSNSAGLYKLGNGELNLNYSPSYLGETRVDNGTLTLNAGFTTSGLLKAGFGNSLGILKINAPLTQINSNGPRSFQSAAAAGTTGNIAEINITEGANILLTGSNPGMMLGDNPGGITNYIQSGGVVNNLGQLWFAGAINTFTQISGSYSCSSTYLAAGGQAGSPANISTLNLSGSAFFTNTASLQFSVSNLNFSGATFNLDGGTYINFGGYGYGGGTGSGPAVWNFNGGKLIQNGNNISIPSQVNTIVKSGGMDVTVNGNSLALTRALSGTLDSGGIKKSGDGTLSMGGFAHSYSGSTTISAGTITVSKIVNSVTGSATFTTGSLSVSFGGATIASGWQYKFFPGSTSLISPFPITLSNYAGSARTASYDFSTSTLTLN